MVVKGGRRVTTDIFVAHAFASLHILRRLEVDEREGFRGRFEAFKFESYEYVSGNAQELCDLSSPKLERRLNSSKLRLRKPGARHVAVGRILAGYRYSIPKINVRVGVSMPRCAWVLSDETIAAVVCTGPRLAPPACPASQFLEL